MIFVLWLQSDLVAMEEIVLLRQRVAQLQERLDNEAADLHQAATIGKQLLEDNSALNKQMEEMASKSSARIEVCIHVGLGDTEKICDVRHSKNCCDIDIYKVE